MRLLHKTRLLCGLLTLCVLLSALGSAMWVSAASVMTGTVHVDDVLRVRSGPSTSGTTTVGYLYNNDVVTIQEVITVSNTQVWYKITKDSISGYACAIMGSDTYITINATYENDEEFEAYLTAQGFPEDYKVKLRELHRQYPKWVFKAQHLTMDYPTALNKQAEVGKNLIQSIDAWKSVEEGAYNWNTNSYVSFDSGGWVTAHRNVVDYCIDPRNWLDSTYVFQFEELTHSDTHTLDGIRVILPDVLDKHAADLLAAAKKADVSAYYLASKIKQEGTDKNGLGTATVPGYEGYYNFFDIGAYAHSGNGAVTNGAIYAKNAGWNTAAKCLNDSAEIIAKSYIKLGQNTVYYQKFNFVNTTSGLYGHQYMTNVVGAMSEGKIRRNSASASELDSALCFVIPVFRNMPKTPQPMPNKNGNNHNTLNALAVSGCTLTPTYSRYTTAYAATVGANVTSVTVDATPSHDTATVTGAGTVALQPGVNTIPIKVTASSGLVRTYTLTVTREGGTAVTPTVTSKDYTVSTTITGVEPDTSVSEFLAALTVKNGTAKVHSADGKEKTSGIIGTGDILRLYSGAAVSASYPVVIYGDANGDGKVSAIDLRATQKHILGTAALKGYYLTAADANRDGTPSAIDLRMIQKHILGVTSTLQP